MKSIKEVNQNVKKYIEKNINKNLKGFGPIIRLENNKYYLAYFVFEYINQNEIKRPEHWLLVNIKNGNIDYVYKSKEKNYSKFINKEKYTVDQNSPLFEYSNDLLKDLNELKKNELNKLKENNSIHNINSLKINKDIINSNEYLSKYIKKKFSLIQTSIFNELNNEIEKYSNFYLDFLIENIRENIINNKINKEEIIEYNKVLKYTYIDIIDLINDFNNIPDIETFEYDNDLNDYLINKLKNDILFETNDDDKYVDIMKLLDEKIIELDNEVIE